MPVDGPFGDAGAGSGVPLLDEGGEVVADLRTAGDGHGAVGVYPGCAGVGVDQGAHAEVEVEVEVEGVGVG